MKQLKTALLALSLFTLTSFTYAGSLYTGQWRGETKSSQGADDVSMKIWLHESSGKIIGRYCLIYQSGNRTDCSGDDETNIRGKVEGSVKANITFDSWFGGKNGKAILVANGALLHWQLVEKPNGHQSYIPFSFELKKISENYNDIKYIKKFSTKTYNMRIIDHCDNFISPCDNVTLMVISHKGNDAFMLPGKTIITKDNTLNFEFFDTEKDNRAELKENTFTLSIAGKSIIENGEWKK
ncbi:hypothetical protein RBA63_13065 [Brenneria goodwinii]|uniref:hypothetical protein n=1 Tax=Brenneria goodwinii TaxID=1109412 RepID=UPI0036EAAD61